MNLLPSLRLLAAACLLSLAPAAARSSDPLPVRASPLALDTQDAARQTVGKLSWRGGLVLQADNPRFGGLSGMAVERDGRRLRAVSDTGTWLTLDLVQAGGRLAGVENARIGPLRGTDGRPLSGKGETDAESLAPWPGGGWLVGFERDHRILRYPAGEEAQGGGLAGIPHLLPAPGELAAAPANAGLEALTVLADGRILAITEDMPAGPGRVLGWIGRADPVDPAWRKLSYRITGAFRPTAAATLPNGDVVMLERSYSPLEGVRVRVVRLRAESLQPDAILAPEELARLEAPVATENLEALDVSRGPDGETLLWLMSDDNFNPLQRTMLLLFALVE